MAEGKSSTTQPGVEPSRRRGAVDERSAPDARPRKRRIWLRVLIVVIVLLIVAAGVLAGLFAWDRWYRYDDEADIQGRWYPVGSTSPVEIGPDTIKFGIGLDTEYSYSIDVHEKTICYTIGSLEGKGHYWFTGDRQMLVIEDGENFNATDLALGDFGRMLSSLNAAIDGTAPALPDGEGISAFTRTIDPEVVAAKAEAERQAKLAEEAARQAEEDALRSEQEAVEAEDEPATDSEPIDEGTADEEADAEAGDSSAIEEEAEKEPHDFTNESMGIFE